MYVSANIARDSIPWCFVQIKRGLNYFWEANLHCFYLCKFVDGRRNFAKSLPNTKISYWMVGVWWLPTNFKLHLHEALYSYNVDHIYICFIKRNLNVSSFLRQNAKHKYMTWIQYELMIEQTPINQNNFILRPYILGYILRLCPDVQYNPVSSMAHILWQRHCLLSKLKDSYTWWIIINMYFSWLILLVPLKILLVSLHLRIQHHHQCNNTIYIRRELYLFFR